MKSLKQKIAGFTLVELMVVVAIIGILSSVAIPNFRKYQAKAKTSEAKLSLAGLYTAETTFLGDYDTYATCLDTMGLQGAPRGYYIYGFGANNAPLNATATTNGAASCTSTTAFSVAPSTFIAGTTLVAALVGTSSAAGTFTAAAAGRVVSGGTLTDRWTINQAKQTANPAVGY